MKPRGTITIDESTCKGCELCVVACPPKVITMTERRNHMGYRLPELHDGCTGCMACQLVCPDFCITVFKVDGEAAAELGATP